MGKKKQFKIRRVQILGFPFTPEDEERMRKACKSAEKFMKNYGKGRKPYSIDLEYYRYKATSRNKDNQEA